MGWVVMSERELNRFDGSDHRWFDDRGDPCTQLIFIDDTLMNVMEPLPQPARRSITFDRGFKLREWR